MKIRCVRGITILVLNKRRPPATGIITSTRTLHLNHFGTEIRQHLAGPGARQNTAEIKYFDMTQRASHQKNA